MQLDEVGGGGAGGEPDREPVMKRPTSSPGRCLPRREHDGRPIIVATAASITPRRPIRLAMAGTASSAAIVPAAKIA